MITELQPGQTLEDKYLIDAKLASGGQGHVYRGTHLVLDRPVAIKLLRVSRLPDVNVRMTKRFEQEARLISSLRDPHTITLYDFGNLGDGSLFMIFEFIDGMSLKEVLQVEKRLAPHRVAKILRQTLSSLQEAHSFGVLHRDIKPANIMLYEHAGRPDQVKLLDFGIAKILDDEGGQKLTAANAVVGTPRYIAPELLLDELPTPGSDIYSLGLVAYELLTGNKAVPGHTPSEIFRSQVEDPPLKLPVSLGVPDGLRSIINQMLEKQLDTRYKTTEAVLFDLKRWHEHKPVASNHGLKNTHENFDPSDLADENFEHEALTNRFSVEEFLESMQDEDATIDERGMKAIPLDPHGMRAGREDEEIHAKQTITDPALVKRLTDPGLGDSASSPMMEIFESLEELSGPSDIGTIEEIEPELHALPQRTALDDRTTRASMQAYSGPAAPEQAAEPSAKKKKKSMMLPVLSVLLFIALAIVFTALLYSKFR